MQPNFELPSHLGVYFSLYGIKCVISSLNAGPCLFATQKYKNSLFKRPYLVCAVDFENKELSIFRKVCR